MLIQDVAAMGGVTSSAPEGLPLPTFVITAYDLNVTLLPLISMVLACETVSPVIVPPSDAHDIEAIAKVVGYPGGVAAYE